MWRTISFAVAGGLLIGCNTPSSACDDYVAETNQLFQRCGYPPVDDTFVVIEGDKKGKIGDCGDVGGVRDMEVLLCDCLPAVESMSCDELDKNIETAIAANDAEQAFPPACRNQFKFVEGSR